MRVAEREWYEEDPCRMYCGVKRGYLPGTYAFDECYEACLECLADCDETDNPSACYEKVCGVSGRDAGGLQGSG